MTEQLKVLLIDDSVDDREFFRRCLKKLSSWDCVVTESESGLDGIAQLRQGGYQIVFIDYSMPGLTGLEMLSDITLRFPDTPIVMVTGTGNEKVAVEALKSGAQDYVTKGAISPDTLEAAIEHALEIKKNEREILRHAYYDELTGLANRRMFDERLNQLIAQASRDGRAFSVVFCDLDGFKAVNDTYGHETGDVLLQQVSERLSRHVREGDLLARIGGDEFVALIHCPSTDNPNADGDIVGSLVAEIRDRPFTVGKTEIDVGLSCGMAMFPDMAKSRADLLRLADTSMYEMKKRSKAAKSRLAAAVTPDTAEVTREKVG